ncbi:MAG: hypothetical protein R3A79_30135 [Nannocystaceae bacterium]
MVDTTQVPAPTHRLVPPGSFDAPQHFYPRVLNAQLHPLVRFFLNLGNDRIIRRYVHLNPTVNAETLHDLLMTTPRFFRWSGSDLLHATTAKGNRQMVIVETNSCPSGQKSMPHYDDNDEQAGYRANLVGGFLPMLRGRQLPSGELAVIYDKNPMEASGYAAALADLMNEPVHLVEFPDLDRHPEELRPQPRARFDNGVLQVRDQEDVWRPIRCAFRYVTQRPWNRIPVATKTVILNPVLTCLAGGRNKLVAAKAYDLYNAELSGTGLKIHTPETIWDVSFDEIPLWIRRLGGHAVIKVPYSNAGQGVYTITSPAELDAFLAAAPRDYDRFIVQSLIGNHKWSSHSAQGRLFHVGTVPNKRGETFVADLRMMISGGPEGFRPLVIYARRARLPLVDDLTPGAPSWDILGTNLSVKRSDGGWDSDHARLLLMDRKDYNSLGLGIDDLIEAYIQTVMATTAIDRMAMNLTSSKGKLKSKLFRSLNDDAALVDEIYK